ncbi:hypothetical protein EYF80_024082 [Liparis tanakae]|uniref:Uncharacterized protein n=1 Tax=Liparis tanakae TaxID=230148 RepID=A0A4Z2HIP0_9TELE|nr:hypothetical protein EYF80_024082 [Liparis tanakae]
MYHQRLQEERSPPSGGSPSHGRRPEGKESASPCGFYSNNAQTLGDPLSSPVSSSVFHFLQTARGHGGQAGPAATPSSGAAQRGASDGSALTERERQAGPAACALQSMLLHVRVPYWVTLHCFHSEVAETCARASAAAAPTAPLRCVSALAERRTEPRGEGRDAEKKSGAHRDAVGHSTDCEQITPTHQPPSSSSPNLHVKKRKKSDLCGARQSLPFQHGDCAK